MIFWRALFTPFGHWQTPGFWSHITNVTKTFFFEIGHLRHPISDRTCRHPRIVFPHTLFAVFFRNRTQTRTSETSDHKSDLLGCKRQSRTVAHLLVAREPLVGKIVHHVRQGTGCSILVHTRGCSMLVHTRGYRGSLLENVWELSPNNRGPKVAQDERNLCDSKGHV